MTDEEKEVYLTLMGWIQDPSPDPLSTSTWWTNPKYRMTSFSHTYKLKYRMTSLSHTYRLDLAYELETGQITKADVLKELYL